MSEKFKGNNPEFKVLIGGKRSGIKELKPKKKKPQKEEKMDCGTELGEEMCPECRDEKIRQLVVEDCMQAIQDGENLERVLHGLYLTAIEVGYRMALENKILDMIEEIEEMNEELMLEYGIEPPDPDKLN